MVWSSSTKRITRPSSREISFNTDLRRSSKSPRYLAPASSAPRSSESRRLFFSPSGTSPFTMRCARPSTMAVLPTPGSPISTGLFLVRRCSTWMVRRISSSRPITGSSLPDAARSVRSTVYFSNACREPSAAASCTDSPPRTPSIAFSSVFLVSPEARSRSPVSPFSSRVASNTSSLEMNLSLRAWESLSAMFRTRTRSFARWTSPETPSTRGWRARNSSSFAASARASTPHFASRGRTVPPGCAISATSRCAGRMKLWSRPSASDCASPSAPWSWLVKRSSRMGKSPCG